MGRVHELLALLVLIGVVAQGEISGLQVLLAGLLVGGSGVATTALWFFSQRYVGELAALPAAAPGGAERLSFSVLDFWGNRQARQGPLALWFFWDLDQDLGLGRRAFALRAAAPGSAECLCFSVRLLG